MFNLKVITLHIQRRKLEYECLSRMRVIQFVFFYWWFLCKNENILVVIAFNGSSKLTFMSQEWYLQMNLNTYWLLISWGIFTHRKEQKNVKIIYQKKIYIIIFIITCCANSFCLYKHPVEYVIVQWHESNDYRLCTFVSLVFSCNW